MNIFKNNLKKTVLPLIVIINFLYGQYEYKYVPTTDSNNDKYVAKIDQINIYTGERETLIDLDKLGFHSYRPYLHHSGTKVFLDSWDEGLLMVDIEDTTQIINLSRLAGDPAMALHCPNYHAQTGKLYLAWKYWDEDEHAEVVDPNTGETIKTFDPFFDICSATFSEDGQRLFAMENLYGENRDFLVIDANTEEIIEQIPFTLFGEGENVMIADDHENKLLISNITDDSDYIYSIDIDTKIRSKKIEGTNSQLTLSLDGKYTIQAVRSSDFDYNHNGEIWIHKVIWPDDGETIPLEDGMYLKFPAINLGYRTYPVSTAENAPEVILYRIDGDKYLIRLKDAKIIRINHRPIAQTFSVFATNSVWLKDSVNVKSGYVGVNDLSNGPFLNANVQLSIDNYAKTAKIEEVFSNSIKVKNNAVVKGNAYTNSLVNNGKVKGTINNPFTFPVLNELPIFETATPDTFDITVLQDEIITLDPGNYGNLVVNIGGKVVFSGGVYNFNSIELKKNAKLRFATTSEVRVIGKLSTKSEAIIAPKTTAEITASDIIFYVTGINGDTGELDAEPKAAKIGTNSTIKANFYVPNGTLHIKADSNAKGAFFSKDVIIGQRAIVKLDSAWELEF